MKIFSRKIRLKLHYLFSSEWTRIKKRTKSKTTLFFFGVCLVLVLIMEFGPKDYLRLTPYFFLSLSMVFMALNLRKTENANFTIATQKEKLTKQNALILKQKKLVEEKNREVLDSITYAKRLQDAILPPLATIKQYLPESFVLYKPKDIVAGDFYWMEKSGDTIFIAAADCTGHGVPGAMVSVVCSTALNRALKEFNITETGKILDKARELVLETFEKSEDNVQDGMDISLCALSYSSPSGEGFTVPSYAHSSDKAATDASLPLGRDGVRVQWSGANNSLWYMQNGEMKEIVADKQPIGKYYNTKSFTTHSIELEKGDTLYLFTDGYADQFGGPKGKKFKYKQLQELIMDNRQLTMEEQKMLLESTLNKWKGNLEQVDDILVIGIRV